MPSWVQNINKMSDLRIVLVSCCAPCSCGAIKQMLDSGDDFIVLFYNPNIYPYTEYQKRLAEQISYCESLNVKYAVGDWDHAKWLESVRGLESAPERGARCSECFKFRFKFAQQWAIEHGYNAIVSVLGVSRHKDQSQVDAAANAVIDKIPYLKVHWDNSLKQTIERDTDFYRQKYCGCEFSVL